MSVWKIEEEQEEILKCPKCGAKVFVSEDCVRIEEDMGGGYKLVRLMEPVLKPDGSRVFSCPNSVCRTRLKVSCGST